MLAWLEKRFESVSTENASSREGMHSAQAELRMAQHETSRTRAELTQLRGEFAAREAKGARRSASSAKPAARPSANARPSTAPRARIEPSSRAANRYNHYVSLERARAH